MPKPLKVDVAEFRPDLGDTEHQFLIDANNVLPGIEGYRSVHGLLLDHARTVGALPNIRTVHTTKAEALVGETTLLGTNDGIYYRQGTSSVYTTLYELPTGTTLAEDEYWSFVTYNGIVYAASPKTRVLGLGLGSITDEGRTYFSFQEIPDSPRGARNLIVYKEVLFAANIAEFEGLIKTSAYRDFENWEIDGINGAEEIVVDTGYGPILSMVAGDDVIYIFQQSQISTLRYTNAETNYQLRQFEPGRGVVGQNAVDVYGSEIYYLSQEGLENLNIKSGQTRNISTGKVSKFLFANSVDVPNIKILIEEGRTLVHVAYRGTAGIETKFDRILSFNYETGAFGVSEIAFDEVHYIPRVSGSIDSEDSDIDFGPLSNQEIDNVTGRRRNELTFYSRGQRFILSGEVLTATIQTAYLNLQSDKKTFIRRIRPNIVWARPHEVTRDSLECIVFGRETPNHNESPIAVDGRISTNLQWFTIAQEFRSFAVMFVIKDEFLQFKSFQICLLYTSPSPRDS